MDHTKIEWTDATWNPVTGCTKVSPGCDHCYAETIAHRFAGTKAYPNGFDVTLHHERLNQPLRWTKSRRVFVNSMSDLFHDDIPDSYIADVWAVMAMAPQHTFQVLTKRHGRMRSLLRSTDFAYEVGLRVGNYLGTFETWPLPNVWLGVSVENQQWADIRIPALLATPAAVRFLSMEPLLGPVSVARYLTRWSPCDTCEGNGSVYVPGGGAACPDCGFDYRCGREDGIDWVIVGGESGKGARPMHPDWARSLRDQCVDAGVPFHFKQWGEHRPLQAGDVIPDKRLVCVTKFPDNDESLIRGGTYPSLQLRVGKKAAGRELDGRTWDEFPGGAA